MSWLPGLTLSGDELILLFVALEKQSLVQATQKDSHKQRVLHVKVRG